MSFRKSFAGLLLVCSIDSGASAIAQDAVPLAQSCSDPHLNSVLQDVQVRVPWAEDRVALTEEILEGLRSDRRWARIEGNSGILFGGIALFAAGTAATFAFPVVAFGVFAASPYVAIPGAVYLHLTDRSRPAPVRPVERVEGEVNRLPFHLLSIEEFTVRVNEAFEKFAKVRNQLADEAESKLSQVQDRWYSLGSDDFKYNEIRWAEAEMNVQLAKLERDFTLQVASLASDLCTQLESAPR